MYLVECVYRYPQYNTENLNISLNIYGTIKPAQCTQVHNAELLSEYGEPNDAAVLAQIDVDSMIHAVPKNEALSIQRFHNDLLQVR